MSDSYFTNRQDRYIIFRNSPELANFFHEIVNNVQTHSYKLTPENTITPFSKFDPVTCSLDEFRESIVGATEKILQKYMENNNKVNSSSSQNALVFPLLQMGCFNYRHDETLTAFLISSLNKNDTTWIASGYFNFPAKYQSLVLNSPSSFNILTASPKVSLILLFCFFFIILSVYLILFYYSLLNILKIYVNIWNRRMDFMVQRVYLAWFQMLIPILKVTSFMQPKLQIESIKLICLNTIERTGHFMEKVGERNKYVLLFISYICY